MTQTSREEMLDKIYAVIWWDYCDVMCDWLKKRGKYPVMIGDVLDWYKKLPKAEIYTDNIMVIVNAWKELCKPIESQDIECILFIYSLLPDAK